MNDESIEFEEIEGELELVPPEIYASNLIAWAVERHASDLFISDLENSVQVAIRRLGKVEPVRRLARNYGHKLQGHFRVLAGADAGETIRPTDGRGVITTPESEVIDIRLSAIPTLYGQDITIRLFDPISGALSIEQLGFDDTELDEINALLHQKAGLILVAGPVASGKSSTLYASLDSLNDGTRKIHTLEDPIEHSLAGVMQTQVNLKAGLDFADLLSTVLRHSPDVIMVGEIRDERTAATAVRAGASGQLVLATIHAKTAVEAIYAMLHYGTHPQFLASSLIGVINQRLVKKLCRECRSPLDLGEVEVPERVRPRLGDKPPQVHQPTGCDSCFGDGFESLICVPEIVNINDAVSDAMAQQVPVNELERLIRSEGSLSLGEALSSRIYRGITTPYEANAAVPDRNLADLLSKMRAAIEA
ncbi:MAG: ATPase, T2SS/T4P/T4SS family, partial [Rubripirellula sp.]|nr:ATPase, T2SS/T4P/T4SS family [Rubripirellula sp.]